MKTRLIPVTSLPIRLGQFLKLADLAQDGLEAKLLIQNGAIIVNGEVETRRGYQLTKGDIIEYEGACLHVTSPSQ